MDSRQVLGGTAILVALSLVVAPVTMADWQHQASFATERVEESQLGEGTPVVHFTNLAENARRVVRDAIASPDGSTTVYGKADRPARFFYSDYTAPGHGEYAVVFDGQYYRLRTYASGGFTFVYWLYEIPFMVYGVVLLWTGIGTADGRQSLRLAGLATGTGVAVHILGPALDFPVLSPRQFVGFGVVATIGLLVGIAVRHFR